MSCKLSDKCDNVFACNILRPNVELLGCNFYKPKKPLTNEEWFASLPTEEKAKWITENITVYADDWVKSDEKLLNPATWVEWLKEMHE